MTVSLFEKLKTRWEGVMEPVLVSDGKSLYIDDILKQGGVDLSDLKPGDVVAVIGGFDPLSIHTLIKLIDMKCVLVPLTHETAFQHEYFFEAAHVDVVIDKHLVYRRTPASVKHELVETVRKRSVPGLVLFSSGTTGKPKAILHDMSFFLERFEIPRPTLKTLSFLLFDHIGGLNTLFHTLFNKGTIINVTDRSIDNVLTTIEKYEVELLPTTPTFLRMMLVAGYIPDQIPECLRIVTYGTERMDEGTLTALAKALPSVDFRQTFGMSELGILRVKSKSRDSLMMKVGGYGIETKIVDDVLKIRSQTRMLGYLNAASPFDDEGWYDTKDIVEQEDEYIKVVGRTSEIINVGGLKFLAIEVESQVLGVEGVLDCRVVAKDNPLTGQHIELFVNLSDSLGKAELVETLKQKLPRHMVPLRVRTEGVTVGHRYKKL